VSRLDLYVDVQGFPLDTGDRERYVCRADARRTYEQSERCSGFDFGSRRGGTVTGRIYDKTVDIANKGTDWWLEIWGDRRTPGTDVTRVEIEFGRQALTEFRLDSPAQVLAAAGELWAYGTEQWLTIVFPPPTRTGPGGPCHRSGRSSSRRRYVTTPRTSNDSCCPPRSMTTKTTRSMSMSS
jgi:hypothetical protein